MPHCELIYTKGLDDDQKEMILRDLIAVIKTFYNAEAEDEPILYNLYEELLDCVTTYNDSVKGRCYVCLDQLCED